MNTLRMWTAVGFAAISALSLATAQAKQGGKSGDAASYLELKAQLDNHCMVRDPTGKLVVLINKHPTKSIRYRIVRIFGGHDQPGLVVGVIAAGGEPVALGCSKIDQLTQSWEVRAAQFAATPSTANASVQKGEK